MKLSIKQNIITPLTVLGISALLLAGCNDRDKKETNTTKEVKKYDAPQALGKSFKFHKKQTLAV